MKMRKYTHILGIDEAGRGPLAGPVYVGAVMLKRKFRLPKEKVLRDSKKLSEKKREEWFTWIRKEERGGRLFSSYASVSPEVIDRVNITRAVNSAAKKAAMKTVKKSGKRPDSFFVCLDGGIYPDFKVPIRSKTIVKGDETVPAIALASIVAKVLRDRKMKKLSEKYPGYGFEVHKGYGTNGHIRAISKRGITKMHRLTFLGNFPIMKEKKRRGFK